MSTTTAESSLENYPIHKPIETGNVLEVKEKVKELPSLINATDPYNYSPLSLASWLGFATIAKVLIENGANIHFKGGKYGSSSLHMAAQRAKLEVLTFLLQCGSNVNVRNNDGNTPLHLAACNGHFNIVKLLIDNGCDINAVTKVKNTALHCAAQSGHFEIVKLLIEKGAALDVTDSKKNTALHFATYQEHFEIVKCLLEKGVNVNPVDKDGDTPLHLAIKSDKFSVELVKVLLDYGADFKLKNKNGISPLEESKSLPGNDVLNIIVDKMSNMQLQETGAKVSKSLYFKLDDCVICDNPREEIFSLYPCGHAKTCELCCLKLIASHDINSVCPICRKEIKDYQKVYF